MTATVALHEADGGEHLLRGRGEVTLLRALVLREALEPQREVVGDEREDRHDDDRDHGDLPRAQQERGERADEQEGARHDVAERRDDELLDDEHVAGDPGEDVARPALVVEGHRQLLQPVVHRDPDVVAELAAAAGQEHLRQRVRALVDGRDEDDGQAEQHDGLDPLVREEAPGTPAPGAVTSRPVTKSTAYAIGNGSRTAVSASRTSRSRPIT